MIQEIWVRLPAGGPSFESDFERKTSDGSVSQLAEDARSDRVCWKFESFRFYQAEPPMLEMEYSFGLNPKAKYLD